MKLRNRKLSHNINSKRKRNELKENKNSESSSQSSDEEDYELSSISRYTL